MHVKDNLFDTKVTPLDVVKVLLLIVTMFSTWNIVELMTPPGAFAWVRELAAVGVVEGAFLGFEYATSQAQSRKQTQLATIGFFCSLAVIAIFAGVSGLVEFAGKDVLQKTVGEWAGLTWRGQDVVMLAALVVLVAWIVALSSIYRLYSLADPDKQTELTKIALNGEVSTAANKALKEALDKATPMISIERAISSIQKDYANELSPDQMRMLIAQVKTHLTHHYAQPAAATQPLISSVRADGPYVSMNAATNVVDVAAYDTGALMTAIASGAHHPVVSAYMLPALREEYVSRRGYYDEIAQAAGMEADDIHVMINYKGTPADAVIQSATARPAPVRQNDFS
jgi:hypothetical protein